MVQDDWSRMKRRQPTSRSTSTYCCRQPFPFFPTHRMADGIVLLLSPAPYINHPQGHQWCCWHCYLLHRDHHRHPSRKGKEVEGEGGSQIEYIGEEGRRLGWLGGWIWIATAPSIHSEADHHHVSPTRPPSLLPLLSNLRCYSPSSSTFATYPSLVEKHL